jgi:hypothetical protein
VCLLGPYKGVCMAKFFIYFFFDFRKINGRTKKIEKYTSVVVPSCRMVVAPHSVKSLPPWGTTAREHLWQQGRVARRQAHTAVRRWPLPPCHTTVSPFLVFFKKIIFKTLLTFLKNNKMISVSIITRSYHNQRVDANSLYKIMVKYYYI